MTPDEFRTLLSERTDSELLELCLRDENPPFVFDPNPSAWDGFRDDLVGSLGVSRQDIRIVGSARFGFSLKPGYELRRFGDTSDIDVVVVNSELFDELWIALLAAAYPRPPNTSIAGGWLNRRRSEVYTGWITPREIRLDGSIFGQRARPALEFRVRWFNAFKKGFATSSTPT
jgi:hypothetical protein